VNIESDVQAIIGDVYLVGGCVRDELLGNTPKDYDFATPLPPDEIENRVKAAGRRAYTTGKRFGTIGFTLNRQFIEVTTFRSETYGKDGRKPEVLFVNDINQDLGRRDFTINAIAKRDTRLIDPYGGRLDLLAKKIKPVGNGTERIKEDPLRMLRAARFAAQLDFEVDPNFIGTMRKHSQKILQISRERWMQEMDKLLLSNNPIAGLHVLADTYLLKFMLPELWIQIGYNQDSPYHELNLWQHTIATVAASPADIDLRWSALLHDIGKPFTRTQNKHGYSNYLMHDIVGAYIVEGIASRLKWSNQRRDTVVHTISTHMSDDNPIRQADNSSKKLDKTAPPTV
jgi:tRNA nucleotidyltransferase (CCA-adding enzyme)